MVVNIGQRVKYIQDPENGVIPEWKCLGIVYAKDNKEISIKFDDGLVQKYDVEGFEEEFEVIPTGESNVDGTYF